MKHLIIILIILFSFGAANAGNSVIVINVDAGIGPGIAEYIENSIEDAEETGAEALVIKLNTPGGLLESTRDIVTSILEAKVPVIVYVAPGGARAGSAGVFITLAANVAAMAPGTHIGAAHPVGLGGESDTTVMGDKITNDAAAFIRSIAQKRGKNQDWAERAVRQSISASENEALKEGAIDVVAPSIDSLLKAVDGMQVETMSGNVTLSTAKAAIKYREMNWQEELMMILSDPNFAYIFIMLAMYGIMFELWNPGSIFPGVIGVISAILAAYSLQLLPVNYIGLAFIVVAIILFILEIKVTSFGLLSLGGIVSFILGSVMLIDSPFEFMEISMGMIITASVLTALFFIFIVGLGLKAQKRKSWGGNEGMLLESGVTLTDLQSGIKGKAKIHGEIWSVVSDFTIPQGSKIIVTAIEGLTLKVEPYSQERLLDIKNLKKMK